MEKIILICALALPRALPPMSEGYKLLRGFIKTYQPTYDVILVNRDERLIGEYKPTPMIYKDLRVWLRRYA